MNINFVDQLFTFSEETPIVNSLIEKYQKEVDRG